MAIAVSACARVAEFGTQERSALPAGPEHPPAEGGTRVPKGADSLPRLLRQDPSPVSWVFCATLFQLKGWHATSTGVKAI